MSEIDYEARDRILKLEERISELQGTTLLTLAELKALRELCITIWQEEGVKVHDTDTISTVLDRMRGEILENLLSTFADEDMKSVSELKRCIEKLLKPEK